MTNPQDLLVQEVAEKAQFRGRPVQWTVFKSPKSESQSIKIQFAITQKWDESTSSWSGEYPDGWYTEHDAWFVGKDGSLNMKTVERLAECGLWDGDFDKLAGPPPNVTCIVSVEYDDYTKKFRASWVNPNSDAPRAQTGGFAPVTSSALEALKAQFGGQARAAAGSASPTASAPQTAPPPPPPPGGAAPEAPVGGPQPTQTLAEEVDEDPPF